MTRDEFESRYRLLQEVTRAGGATTHNAIGPAGAVVMVHFLQDDLLERVRPLVALSEADRPDRIVTLLEVDDLPVLVTKFIMDFPDLGSWLDETAPISGGARPAAEETAFAPESGDFTDMFEAVDPPVPAAREEDGSPPGLPPAGEFTGLFHAAGAETPPGKTLDSSPSADGVPGEAPGEFTRMFGALDPPGAPRDPEPPIEGIQTDPPEEEKGLEDRRPPPPPPPSPPPLGPPPATLDGPAAPTPVPPPPLHSDSPGIPEPHYGASDGRPLPDASPPDPGGLTARFATPSQDRPFGGDTSGDSALWSAVSEERTPDHTVSDDYLERLHAAGPPPSSPTPPPPPTAPPTPPEERGPGAYTRVIAGVRPPSARPPSGSPPSPPLPERGSGGSEKRDSIIPFLLVIGLIVVLALGLVVGYVILSNRA